jgi:hypothetical protein
VTPLFLRTTSGGSDCETILTQIVTISADTGERPADERNWPVRRVVREEFIPTQAGSAMSLTDTIKEAAGIAPDPAKERALMLSKLRHARQSFEEKGGDLPGASWFSADANGRVAFSPTRPDGQQLVIGGQSITFWEAGDLPGMLDAFEAAVNAGELDPQLTGPTPAGHSLPLERLTVS